MNRTLTVCMLSLVAALSLCGCGEKKTKTAVNKPYMTEKEQQCTNKVLTAIVDAQIKLHMKNINENVSAMKSGAFVEVNPTPEKDLKEIARATVLSIQKVKLNLALCEEYTKCLPKKTREESFGSCYTTARELARFGKSKTESEIGQ